MAQRARIENCHAAAFSNRNPAPLPRPDFPPGFRAAGLPLPEDAAAAGFVASGLAAAGGSEGRCPGVDEPPIGLGPVGCFGPCASGGSGGGFVAMRSRS